MNRVSSRKSGTAEEANGYASDVKPSNSNGSPSTEDTDTLTRRILERLNAFVTIIGGLSASILVIFLITFSDSQGRWPRGENIGSTANLPTTLSMVYLLLGVFGLAACALQWKRPAHHSSLRGRLIAYSVLFVALVIVTNLIVLVGALVDASGMPKESFRWFSP